MIADIDARHLSLDQIEEIEKLSLRLVFQALVWFAPQAWDFFDRSPDDPQDVAEDVTREALSSFGGFVLRERLFGTIDFKQARWLPMPYGLVPQAMMVDSKAKKVNEQNRLDLQMSQVSMTVYLESKDRPILPLLRPTMEFRFENGQTKQALTTVITAHYSYDDKAKGQVGKWLRKLTLCAVPNGLLQERYSPNRQRTVFGVGKHSSGRGEEPRVRVYYETVRQFAHWRVQEINFDAHGKDAFAWEDVGPDGQPHQENVVVEPRISPPFSGQAQA